MSKKSLKFPVMLLLLSLINSSTFIFSPRKTEAALRRINTSNETGNFGLEIRRISDTHNYFFTQKGTLQKIISVKDIRALARGNQSKQFPRAKIKNKNNIHIIEQVAIPNIIGQPRDGLLGLGKKYKINTKTAVAEVRSANGVVKQLSLPVDQDGVIQSLPSDNLSDKDQITFTYDYGDYDHAYEISDYSSLRAAKKRQSASLLNRLLTAQIFSPSSAGETPTNENANSIAHAKVFSITLPTLSGDEQTYDIYDDGLVEIISKNKIVAKYNLPFNQLPQKVKSVLTEKADLATLTLTYFFPDNTTADVVYNFGSDGAQYIHSRFFNGETVNLIGLPTPDAGIWINAPQWKLHFTADGKGIDQFYNNQIGNGAENLVAHHQFLLSSPDTGYVTSLDILEDGAGEVKIRAGNIVYTIYFSGKIYAHDTKSAPLTLHLIAKAPLLAFVNSSRNYLLDLIDFNPSTDLIKSLLADYASPAVLAYSIGQSGGSFNKEDGYYPMSADNDKVEFIMDGRNPHRYYPVFQVGNWTSKSLPNFYAEINGIPGRQNIDYIISFKNNQPPSGSCPVIASEAKQSSLVLNFINTALAQSCTTKSATLIFQYLGIVTNRTKFYLDPIITWTASSAGNWSTGANWSGGVAPGSTDTATFSASSTVNATIDAAISVAGIDIQSTYSGTISTNTGNTITVGNSAFSQAAGTFTAGDATTTLNGNFTLSGGTLNLTSANTVFASSTWTVSGGTVNASSGTVIFGNSSPTITGSVTFNNLSFGIGSTLNRTYTVSSTSILTVSSTLTFDTGGGDNGTLTAANGTVSSTIEALGDIIFVDSNNYSGTVTIVASSTKNQLMNGNMTSSTGAMPTFVINKTGGTLTLGNILHTSKNWTYTAGTLDAATSTVVFGGATITGSHTLNNVNFAGTPINSVTGTVSSTTTLTVSSTLTFGPVTTGSYVLNTGAVDALGDIVFQTTGVYGGTATINASGTKNQLMQGNMTSSTGAMPLININKTGGTLTLGNIFRTAKNWTYTAGTLDAATSTVVFSGGNTITGSHTLNNVTINSSSTASATVTTSSTATLTVSSTFIAANTGPGLMFLTGGIISIQGDASTTATLAGTGTTRLQFTGSKNQNLNFARFTASSTFINKTGGVAQLVANLNATTTNQNFNLVAGTFNLNGFNLAVGNGGSVNVTSTLQLQGGETVSSTRITLNPGSTVVFMGNGDGVATTYTITKYATSTWRNLTVSSTDALDVFQTTSTISIFGDLTITKGIFDINGNSSTFAATSTISNSDTFRLTGAEALVNFNNSSNTVGTVVYNGTATYNSLAAGPNYYNLTFNGSGGSWTPTSSNMNVNNNLTLTAGTFVAPTGTLSLQKDFNNNGGSFTHNSGVVSLTGTLQTIYGTSTFNSLSKTVTSADTLTFSSTTQTVAGTLTLQGAVGNQLLSLRSTDSGVQWKINPQGTRTIAYLNVQDSNNTNSTNISCPIGCVNSGNNTGWTFFSAGGGGGGEGGGGGSRQTGGGVGGGTPPEGAGGGTQKTGGGAGGGDSAGNVFYIMGDFASSLWNWFLFNIYEGFIRQR